MERYTLHHGDCLDVLRGLPEASVDSIVTDPPAGISFMGKEWDSNKGGRDGWVAWLTQVMEESLRVLRPGGHALVWAIPRTSHWTATAIEDAGFEVRDVITHHFGSGFPKSMDVSKAIDKAAGAERKPVGVNPSSRPNSKTVGGRGFDGDLGKPESAGVQMITAPATPEAQQWEGWGTALKPASEHWILARKPFKGTVANNVLEHGTGALNVDGCRVGENAGWSYPNGPGGSQPGHMQRGQRHGLAETPMESTKGRWPANLILSHSLDCQEVAEAEFECVDDCPLAIMDGQSGEASYNPPATWRGGTGTQEGWGNVGKALPGQVRGGYGDKGGASRFFYCPKAPKKDKGADNTHPTVKNTALMAYLCRLITPPDGVVLDPFMGSGSTGVAALREGFRFIGIEQEAEYLAISQGRIAGEAEVA